MAPTLIWKPIPVRIFYTFVIYQGYDMDIIVSYLRKDMTSYTIDMTWISQMQII